MTTNDALLLGALLRPHPLRDGPDPFGFMHTPAWPPGPTKPRAPPHAPGRSPRPPPPLATFVAANDLDTSYYTVHVLAVSGLGEHGGGVPPVRPAMVGAEAGLTVGMQLFHLGEPLTPVVCSSPSRPWCGPRGGASVGALHGEEDDAALFCRVFDAAETALPREWFNEALVLPVPVAELPLDCEVRCHVRDADDQLLGHCAFHPFSLAGELESGHRRQSLRTSAGDPDLDPLSTSGPHGEEAEGHAPASTHGPATPDWERHTRARHRGTLPAVPWLDGVTQRHLDALRALPETDSASGPDTSPSVHTPVLHLLLPVPGRATPVMFLTDAMDAAMGGGAAAATNTIGSATLQSAVYGASVTMPYVDHYRIMKEYNVCEAAAGVAAKSMLLLYDAGATPGLRDRERLAALAARPPLQLEPPRLEDVTLLWRYRHYITRDPRLFTLFMRTVSWGAPAQPGARAGHPQRHSHEPGAPEECRAACELMARWRPLGLADVLGCLGCVFGGIAPVRAHALRMLGRESDAQLCWLVPQLVQCLRYDSVEAGEAHQWLLRRALGHWELCSLVYWGVTVEAAIPGRLGGARGDVSHLHRFRAALVDALRQSAPHQLRRLEQQRALCACMQAIHSALHRTSGDRGARISVGQRLLEKNACGIGELFSAAGVAEAGPHAGSGGGAGGGSSSSRPSAAGEEGCGTGAGGGSSSSSHRKGQTVARGATAQGPPPSPLDAAGLVPLLTHPAFGATGVVPDSFYLFKSAKQPMQVGLVVTGEHAPGTGAAAVFEPLAVTQAQQRARAPPTEVRLIYKINDDVRQDQLALQLVRWVDSLLRLDGLDLCLTPYRVVATGPSEGFVEVVPDVVTFQSVQRDALRYLRTHNATPEALHQAMSRYTRSLAGYSVFTFVLGVGDRHLENILLAQDGRLLHIDFGYILGHDPKPFPPPMKISREMLEVLGGPESAGYTEFKTFCCMAYNILRKHAALLVNLLQLLCHAGGLPQLTGDEAAMVESATVTAAAAASPAGPDPRLNILKVQERLRLDLSNAQATQYIQKVMADSVGSIFTGLWDVIHAAAQATRN